MTKTVLKQEALKISNEDWPALALSDGSKNRFQIKKKTHIADIEGLAKTLEAVSTKDDKIVAKNNAKDEEVMKQVTAIVPKKVAKVISEPIVAKAKVAKKPVTKTVQKAPQKAEKPKTVPVSVKVAPQVPVQLIENREEAIAKVAPPVNPQTTPSVASPLTPRGLSSAKVTEETTINSVIKFVVAGLAYLFMQKTNKVLKPLEFVSHNFSNVFAALLYLMVPVVMTWYLVNKVEFVATKMSLEGVFTYWAYNGVFYIASLFIFISSFVIISGLVSMVKTTLTDVAKIGKETK